MSKTVIGSDDVEYELISLEDFKVLGQNDPLIAEAAGWIQNPPRDTSYTRLSFTSMGSTKKEHLPTSTQPENIYYHPSIVEAIKGLGNYTPYHRWEFFMAFAPPVAQLTVQDYLDWCEDHYRKKDTPSNPYGGTLGLNMRPGSIGAYSWYGGRGWREELLTEASEYKPANTNAYSNHDWLYDVFEIAFYPRESKQDLIEDTIRLNEYLHGEGKDFAGSFQEYLATEISPTVKDYISRHFFKNYGGKSLAELVEFTGRKTVAYYGPTVQARSRKLLYSQDREVWLEIIESSARYSKGKTFQHLQQYLAEVHEKLGRGKASDYKILSPSELRREYTLLVAEAVLFEGRSYNPDKLHGLATVALQAVPGEHELKKYAREYSEIYLMVRDLLSNRKQEDESAPDHLTLMQTIGLLLATFYPNTWLRNNVTNGPYLLRDIVREKGLHAIQLLSEIILEHKGALPTENEWRKAIQDVDFDNPADFFIIMVCSANALKKNQARKRSDIVDAARSNFGTR